MDAFFIFLILAMIVAGAAWFLFALRGDRIEKQRNHAQATALGSRLLCPTCNLPTLQWSQQTWDAETQYLDGTTKMEHGFTYFCVNCSRLYDFTKTGEYRPPAE